MIPDLNSKLHTCQETECSVNTGLVCKPDVGQNYCFATHKFVSGVCPQVPGQVQVLPSNVLSPTFPLNPFGSGLQPFSGH